jgi:hypothetical protein
LARGLRIRAIRRRIAYGATVMVAVFSGAILFRSLEQTAGSAVASGPTRPVHDDDGGDGDESSLATRLSSVFDDDGEDESSSPATAPSSSSSSTLPPLTTSQS